MIQKICHWILYGLLGWKLDGVTPDKNQRLLIVYLPHTSNWDFVIGMLFAKAENIAPTVFGKDQFYFLPFSWVYDYCNVVPIKRDAKNNFVNTAAALYDNGAKLLTIMAPEGTRSKVKTLKSGYYYFAKKANIAIMPAGFDFPKKIICLGQSRALKDSFEEDQKALIDFSRNITPKCPKHVITH